MSPEASRAKRRAIAEAQGRTVREYRQSGLWSANPLEYKRQQRIRKAAKEGRVYIPRKRDDAHVKAFKVHLRAIDAERRLAQCDAHVRRFRAVQALNDRRRRKYWANPDAGRARGRDAKQRLVESYVVFNLKAMGVPRSEITPEIIQIKREQITLRRLSRRLKTAAANSLKEGI